MKGLSTHRLAPVSLAFIAAAAAGCRQSASPEELARIESHLVSATPDAVFAAARSYYAARGYTTSVLDTDARLIGAYRMAASFPDAFSDPNAGPYRLEVVWVRPSGQRFSNVRIRAVWGLELLEEERPAALAAEFEAIALGRKKADQPTSKGLPP